MSNLFVAYNNIISIVYLRLDSPFPKKGPSDNIQIVLAIVALAGREEGAIKIAPIVIDSPTATIATGQSDATIDQVGDIRFGERILMTSNNNARIVGPQQEHMMIDKVEVLVEPILQCQVGEDIMRLRDEHRFLNISISDRWQHFAFRLQLITNCNIVVIGIVIVIVIVTVLAIIAGEKARDFCRRRPQALQQTQLAGIAT